MDAFNWYRNHRIWMAMLWYTNYASFIAQLGHLQWHKCSSGTLLSASMRLMQIFAGVPWQGGLRRRWCGRERQFLVILVAIPLEPLELRWSITIQRHEVPYRLSIDPKMRDFEWPWDAILCWSLLPVWLDSFAWFLETTAWKRIQILSYCQW